VLNRESRTYRSSFFWKRRWDIDFRSRCYA
jgi:hypothetical protein